MNRSNLILLIVAMILAVILHYPIQPKEEQQILTSIDPKRVDNIYIVRTPLPDIHLKKQQQQWYLQSQLADQTLVSKILGLLQSRSFQQFSSVGKSLEEYGLEQTQTRIRFNNTDLVFGKEEPLHSHRYVLYNQQIHLINNYYYYLLRSDISHFIDEKEQAKHSG